ncbi:MAG TPA: DUF4292 domain-containing protein [Chitinophagaceae bacterium]|nr:DUF4292 domain-containing protein [Chitinophagaceae bacterium]
MKQQCTIIAFIIIVLASACKSAKKIQTAITKTKTDTTQMIKVDNSHADSIAVIHDLMNKLNINRITQFKTFSAKVKVNYRDKEGEQPELTVFIRMQKDSLIWISVNATIFSYEALRVLITPDSVQVLNKKDKIVQLRSVNYLKELTDLPFDFHTLQDLLLGNPIYLDSNVVSYKKNDQSITLMNIGPLFKNLLSITNGDYLLQHSKLDDADPLRNRTADLTYGGYETSNGVKFATERRVSVSEKGKLDIDMNFKQYSFNETLSYPFSIPKNFKRK